MSINQEVELLGRIPLFAKIEASKLKLIAFTSQRLTYGEGQELFHQGDVGDAAYIVIDGEAAVLIDTDKGQIKVATLQRGDIVGEIAILCDVPRTATVQAASALTTLRISKDMFYRLVTDFPAISIEIMRELAQRVERTNAKLRELASRAPA